MPSMRFRAGACLLSLLLATSVAAQDGMDMGGAKEPAPDAQNQAIYKGLVGNALDALPMDPVKRVNLQRVNAVVSNTASGRVIAGLAGLSNPLFLVGGLAWGVWSALNIFPEPDTVTTYAPAGRTNRRADTDDIATAQFNANQRSRELNQPKSGQNALAREYVAQRAMEKIEAVAPSHPVIKVWLTQRSTN